MGEGEEANCGGKEWRGGGKGKGKQIVTFINIKNSASNFALLSIINSNTNNFCLHLYPKIKINIENKN